jgi:biotin carboxyl carrier protein
MKYIVTINNKDYEVEVERGKATLAGTNEVALGTVKTIDGAKVSQTVTESQAAQETNGEDEELRCPMPGTILDIKVTQGSRVKRGDVLFILEAMKMENEISAPKDGVVTQISIAKGASVATNDLLAVIK